MCKAPFTKPFSNLLTIFSSNEKMMRVRKSMRERRNERIFWYVQLVRSFAIFGDTFRCFSTWNEIQQIPDMKKIWKMFKWIWEWEFVALVAVSVCSIARVCFVRVCVCVCVCVRVCKNERSGTVMQLLMQASTDDSIKIISLCLSLK